MNNRCPTRDLSYTCETRARLATRHQTACRYKTSDHANCSRSFLRLRCLKVSRLRTWPSASATADHQVAGPEGGAGLRWGVEPMCAVLSEHGVPISPSTYYEWIAKAPTRRQFRDTELVEIITAARENTKVGRFVQTLGSRKLWIWLRGQGHDVARCTVERIMRQQGWEGAVRVQAQDDHRR